jgi:hypothetical protein
MSKSFVAILERLKTEAMLRQAEAIRDYPDCSERTEQARQMIRRVLYESALGTMTNDNRQQILDVLQLARSPCSIEPSQPIPTFQDERTLDEALKDAGQEIPKKQRTFFFMP